MTNPLRFWTIGRATSVGISTDFLALILWPAYTIFQNPVRIALAASLAVAAFCGLSILAITAADITFHRARGARLRAIRVFDIALALLMGLPAALALPDLIS